jgi:hypothetical protein
MKVCAPPEVATSRNSFFGFIYRYAYLYAMLASPSEWLTSELVPKKRKSRSVGRKKVLPCGRCPYACHLAKCRFRTALSIFIMLQVKLCMSKMTIQVSTKHARLNPTEAKPTWLLLPARGVHFCLAMLFLDDSFYFRILRKSKLTAFVATWCLRARERLVWCARVETY